MGDFPLVAIVGPTAAGKSALALALAERLDGEIVNYDSVQLYRGFDVGSGKLAPAERHGIAHHLLDCLEPSQVFTAGDYRREALQGPGRSARAGEAAHLRRRHGALPAGVVSGTLRGTGALRRFAGAITGDG